ncbi:MAG TPA: hypothetical protein VJB57_02930 [Dehalococcoidia bacterium]|nr:hypothetical protein [Dehalococcoidia bacterium]
MAEDDDLMRQALAVGGQPLAAEISSTIRAIGGFPPQFLNAAPPWAPNPLFPPAYVNAAITALQAVLNQLVRNRDGTANNARQAQVALALNLATDVGLQLLLQTAVANEAPNWVPGTERERDLALVATLTKEFVRQRPGRLQAVVDIVRQAREDRIAAERPPRWNEILRPVPPEGDVLVRELSRPARAFGVRLLRGYLGPSEVAGFRRLFRTLEFNEYLDIPSDSVVKTLDLRTITNPVGGSLVWVAVGTRLVHGTVGYTRPEVAGRFLAGGRRGGLGRGEEWTERGFGEEWTERGEEWTERGEEWTERGR